MYEALALGCGNRQLPSAVSNASECGCVYEGLVLGCDNRQFPSAVSKGHRVVSGELKSLEPL